MESDLKGSFTEIVTLQGQWGLLQIPSVLTSISSRRRCDNCSMWNLPRHNHLFGRAGKSWFTTPYDMESELPALHSLASKIQVIFATIYGIRMILHGQWLVVVMRNLNIARRGWLLTTRWPDGHHATLWMDTKPHCGWTLSIGQWTPRAAHCGGGTTLSAHFTDHTCTFVTFLLNICMNHYSVQISLERRIGNTVLHHGILQLSHTPLTSCSNGWQWLKWWHQNGPILFCLSWN